MTLRSIPASLHVLGTPQVAVTMDTHVCHQIWIRDFPKARSPVRSLLYNTWPIHLKFGWLLFVSYSMLITIEHNSPMTIVHSGGQRGCMVQGWPHSVHG